MIGYVKHFASNKTMFFKVNDNRLFKKYSKIWDKVSILMNTEFDGELVYVDNDKYIKEKLKTYTNKANKNFQGKNIPKENASYKCLLLITLDSVVKVSEKYYPQILLEECKYKIKKTKIDNLIDDDFDLSSSDDETDNDSDNENEFYNDE